MAMRVGMKHGREVVGEGGRAVRSRGEVACVFDTTRFAIHPQYAGPTRRGGSCACARRVLSMESQTEATALLTGNDKVEDKFALLESGTVDDELSALKKSMKPAGALPEGRSPAPEGRLVKDALDLELEELRKKARE
eukprot:103042-Chlamydomonas_euryale.AAC.7